MQCCKITTAKISKKSEPARVLTKNFRIMAQLTNKELRYVSNEMAEEIAMSVDENEWRAEREIYVGNYMISCSMTRNFDIDVQAWRMSDDGCDDVEDEEIEAQVADYILGNNMWTNGDDEEAEGVYDYDAWGDYVRVR